MTQLIKLALICTLVASQFMWQTKAYAVDYEAVDSNVSYSSVTHLEYDLPDEHISYGSSPLQMAHFWWPKLKPKGELKLVVLVHGGCWLNAFDISHTYALSTALAQAGYAVWSLEYRRTGDDGGGWPGSLADVETGIKRISEYAKGAFSLENTVLMGHSAGGHLALLAGEKFSQLRAVFGLAAITDLVSYSKGTSSCQLATAKFMGGNAIDKADDYKMANPISQSMHPTTILLQGNIDSIVPVTQAQALDKPIIMLNGAGHFDWVHPGTDAFQILLNQLNRLFQ